jgi:hypothetical protein
MKDTNGGAGWIIEHCKQDAIGTLIFAVNQLADSLTKKIIRPCDRGNYLALRNRSPWLSTVDELTVLILR